MANSWLKVKPNDPEFRYGIPLRLRRLWKRGLINGISAKMLWIVKGWLPSVRRAARQNSSEELAYDRKLGVSTAGRVHPAKLHLSNPNSVHATPYQGTPVGLFISVMGSLGIDYNRFVFIDFGSGKGRALFLASEFSFKRIVGIEFSEELHAAATRNVNEAKSSLVRKNIELLCMDAVNYSLPEEPCICYFYNPFDAVVLSRVLANIRGSFHGHPRDIFIVYCNPREGHLLDQDECCKRVSEIGSFRIWKMEKPTIQASSQ